MCLLLFYAFMNFTLTGYTNSVVIEVRGGRMLPSAGEVHEIDEDPHQKLESEVSTGSNFTCAVCCC